MVVDREKEMPGPGEGSASGQAETPRVPQSQSGVIGVMIKVSAPPFEYVGDGLGARPRKTLGVGSGGWQLINSGVIDLGL